MIDIVFELDNLNNNLESFTQDLNRLEGSKNLLSQQINDCHSRIKSLEVLRVKETKAVELLHLVQRATRDKVVAAFEQTVTYALRAIYQNDGYAFKLEFSQRGNLGELDFKMKSPTTKGYLNLKNCTCGGEHDVISVALRFMLLQIIQPKFEGFVGLDEPTKQLSSEFRINESHFYETMFEKLGRQIIIVTHSDELKALAKNKIQIGPSDVN